jgi:uncharacterized membrane protein
MTLNYYKIIRPLAILGIGLALYLLYEYLAPGHKSLCYVNAYVNCEASTKGLLANTLGLPTAVWGLVGYIFILLAAIRKWPRVVLGMATFGLLFCLRITFLEIFVVKALCPVCLTCQLDMIALFVLGCLLNSAGFSKFWARG